MLFYFYLSRLGACVCRYAWPEFVCECLLFFFWFCFENCLDCTGPKQFRKRAEMSIESATTKKKMFFNQNEWNIFYINNVLDAVSPFFYILLHSSSSSSSSFSSFFLFIYICFHLFCLHWDFSLQYSCFLTYEWNANERNEKSHFSYFVFFFQMWIWMEIFWCQAKQF